MQRTNFQIGITARADGEGPLRVILPRSKRGESTVNVTPVLRRIKPLQGPAGKCQILPCGKGILASGVGASARSNDDGQYDNR
jgi:hypothetical protein